MWHWYLIGRVKYEVINEEGKAETKELAWIEANRKASLILDTSDLQALEIRIFEGLK